MLQHLIGVDLIERVVVKRQAFSREPVEVEHHVGIGLGAHVERGQVVPLGP
jgi:hypothetical protein